MNTILKTKLLFQYHITTQYLYFLEISILTQYSIRLFRIKSILTHYCILVISIDLVLTQYQENTGPTAFRNIVDYDVQPALYYFIYRWQLPLG